MNLIDRVGLKVKEGHKRFDPIGGADTDLSQFDDYVAEIFGCFIPLMHKSLNNISKHAHSNHVKLQLHCLHERTGSLRKALLSIQDDGCGFEPETVSQDHLGLGIMQERAQNVGASLSVESDLGRGTLITLIWNAEE